MANGSSLEKAFFTNLDTRSVLHVQFNPSRLSLDDAARWITSDAVEQTHPELTYQRGEPTTLAMELVFDATDSQDNVNDQYVRPLRAFLTSNVEVKDAAGINVVARRPPYCTFTWGSFEFEGVVENIASTFLMFRPPEGTPIRARVSLSMKQASRAASLPRAADLVHEAMGVALSMAPAPVATHVAQVGDTLSGIAAAVGVNERLIAIANGIDNPLELSAGTRLLIPGSAEQAEALGAQRRRASPARWAGGEDPAPDLNQIFGTSRW